VNPHTGLNQIKASESVLIPAADCPHFAELSVGNYPLEGSARASVLSPLIVNVLGKNRILVDGAALSAERATCALGRDLVTNERLAASCWTARRGRRGSGPRIWDLLATTNAPSVATAARLMAWFVRMRLATTYRQSSSPDSSDKQRTSHLPLASS
jgi:hypothetical protein